MNGARLESILLPEIEAPVAPAIACIAEAARTRHGTAVCAVLFYGSCLRLESDEGKIVDLYLVVDNYRAAYGAWLPAAMNRLLPPNVYYLEAPFEDRLVRAKVAVISLADFRAGTDSGWFHSYLWARFAQPCRLTYARDTATRQAILTALATASRTLVREALPLLPASPAPKALWVRAFQETYRSELRAERPGQAEALYDANAARYEAITEALDPSETKAFSHGSARRRWALRRAQGKLLSVLRLMKAAFTFSDGASYLLWKIQRHSGVTIEVSPWQKRHPILASGALFWRLYRKGAFR